MALRALPVKAALSDGAAKMCSAGIANAEPIMVCGRVNFQRTMGKEGVFTISVPIDDDDEREEDDEDTLPDDATSASGEEDDEAVKRAVDEIKPSFGPPIGLTAGLMYRPVSKALVFINRDVDGLAVKAKEGVVWPTSTNSIAPMACGDSGKIIFSVESFLSTPML